MTETSMATGESLRIQPGDDVLAGIEWFTMTGATSPTGSSLQVDDLSTAMTSPVPGNQSLAHPDVARAAEFIRTTLCERDGFVGAALLAGHRGELVVYSQWHPRAAAAAQFPDAWSIAPALAGLERFEARVFEASFVGPAAASVLALGATRQAHFGYFTVAPENQPELIELARTNAPESFAVPGLQAVNFHRSLDGKRVVNLGLWDTLDKMQELMQRPGFKPGAKYWLEIAGFRPHFFEVAAVVTP